MDRVGAGLVGVPGTGTQSSERLSSHGWLLIVGLLYDRSVRASRSHSCSECKQRGNNNMRPHSCSCNIRQGRGEA